VWIGPFEVTEIDPITGNCKLDIPKNRRIYPWFATDMLRRYYFQFGTELNEPDLERWDDEEKSTRSLTMIRRQRTILPRGRDGTRRKTLGSRRITWSTRGRRQLTLTRRERNLRRRRRRRSDSIYTGIYWKMRTTYSSIYLMKPTRRRRQAFSLGGKCKEVVYFLSPFSIFHHILFLDARLIWTRLGRLLFY